MSILKFTLSKALSTLATIVRIRRL